MVSLDLASLTAIDIIGWAGFFAFIGLRLFLHVWMLLKQGNVREELESKREQLSVYVMMVLGVVMGIVSYQNPTVTEWTFVNVSKLLAPETDQTLRLSLKIAGSVLLWLCFLGIAWVHYHLGMNWSPHVVVFEKHTLVTSGPYALARHPMYSVMLAFMVGLFFFTLNWIPLIFPFNPVAWVLLIRKIRMEERAMIAEFGADYVDYIARVGALHPSKVLDVGLTVEDAKNVLKEHKNTPEKEKKIENTPKVAKKIAKPKPPPRSPRAGKPAKEVKNSTGKSPAAKRKRMSSKKYDDSILL